MLLDRRYADGKSPWEVVLFNGGGVVGFRVHHSVADGLSILKMFVERVGGKRLVKASASRRGKDDGVFVKVLRVCFGVGENWGWWVKGFFYRSEVFSVSRSGGCRDVAVGGRVLFCDVKGVGRRAGVCGSSVIIAG